MSQESPVEFNFDSESFLPTEVPVKYKQTDYVLREATSGAAKDFANARIARVKMGSAGEPTAYGSLGDLEPLLVSMCLFELSGKPVTMKFVELMPYRMQKALYDKAREISGLDDDDPLAVALELALTRDDAPVTKDALVTWLSSLDGPQFTALTKLGKALAAKSKN